MLGYPRAIGFTTDSAFGGARDGTIWLDEVNCTGHENTLAVCAHDGWGISDCDHTEDAGVICEFNYTVDAKGEMIFFRICQCILQANKQRFAQGRENVDILPSLLIQLL